MLANNVLVERDSPQARQRQTRTDGLAVRPEHEMVGHTGFVSIARLICQALEPGR